MMKRLFPDPVAAKPTTKTYHDGIISYCVGGAIIMFRDGYSTDPLDYEYNRLVSFVAGGDIARALRDLNPALTPEDASWFQSEIVKRNDQGNFQSAWEIAERALVNEKPCRVKTPELAQEKSRERVSA